MTKKESYMLVVAHQAGASLKRINVSYRFMFTLCVLCLISAVAISYAVYRYKKTTTLVSDYQKLLEENKRVKLENQSYKLLTEQVGEKISALEITSKKLSIISGLEPLKPRQGGTGGYSIKEGSLTPPLPEESLDQLQTLKKKIPNLEAKYRQLNEFYKEQFLLNVHAPSIWPVRGYLSRGFGYHTGLESDQREYHAGIDISAPYGNRVIAPAAGVVVFAGYRKDYGNLIVLSHKFGFTTLYGHLSRIMVKVGDRVDRYETIGLIGSTGRSTGPHLHYEVRVNNQLVNPYKFIKEDRHTG